MFENSDLINALFKATQNNPDMLSTLAAIREQNANAPMSEQAPVQAPPAFEQTHRNWLGRLADAVNIAYGNGQIYENRMRERDATRAMSGYATDPMAAINNLSQVPGMQETAAKLYDSVDDNRRQDEQVKRMSGLYDLKKDEYVYNRVASMMGGANEKNWSGLRSVALDLGNRYGVDVSNIVPESYDPDSIPYIQAGAIKPADQEKLKETAGYHAATIDTRKRGQDLTATYRQQRNAEDVRHHTVMENKPPRGAQPKPQPTSVMTKYGPAIISKDGTKMVVTREGKHYGYVKTGNANGKINWTPVGEVKIKGQQ